MATSATIQDTNALQPSSGHSGRNRRSIWDGKIARQALLDAIKKLNPRTMMRNPVMFVVEIGSVVTTLLLFRDITAHHSAFSFDLQITLWLWFTVLFANFAEAMAEGRGKAQADTLRRAKSETTAHRVLQNGEGEDVRSSELRAGDIVVVLSGEMIPGDGEIIEGVASVDESAITGESAPVIRESGGDLIVFEGHETVVGDGYAMSVAGQVVENLFGAAERRLGVDDPVLLAELPEEVAEWIRGGKWLE